jgi:Replicative DNA helicase
MPKQINTNIPPQNLEIEKAVLGSILIDTTAMDLISDKLNEETFYDPKHKMIFKSICDLYASNYPIDLLTVTNK